MSKRRAEAGQIMPMVALLMVVLVGIAAFAIDGSNIYSQHRRFQADLDVAVKVAASEMFDFDPSSSAYTDTARTALSDAARILAEDGYANTLTVSTTIQAINGDYRQGFCGTDATAGITLCNPPQSGPYVGKFDYVEGRLRRSVGGFFDGVLGLGQMSIGVRAVAWHGGYHEPYAIIGLDPSGCSINVQDNSSLTVNGSIMADGQSCVKNGTGNAVVYGHSDAYLPTVAGNSSQITGQGGTNTGVARIVDPYPVIPLSPSPITAIQVCALGCPHSSFSDVGVQCASWVQSNLVGIITPQANTVYYFPPDNSDTPALVSNFSQSGGTYYFLPHCDGSPAVYYFSGSPQDIKISGQVYINSVNSVFVLDDSASTLIQATGSIQDKWVLDAPHSGPYQGIALYEEQPCTNGKPMALAGSANSLIDGVVDTPCANLAVTGDSTDNPFVNGVVVGYDVTVAGNGTAIVNYDPSGTPPDKGSVLVE